MTHDSVKISFKLVPNYSLPDLNLEQAGTIAVILCISSIPLCIDAQISITTATRLQYNISFYVPNVKSCSSVLVAADSGSLFVSGILLVLKRCVM